MDLIKSKYWSNRIKDNEAYVPGEQINEDTYIKLNANENPYPPSKNAQNAIQQMDKSKLRLYPDFGCHKLRTEIAKYYNIKTDEVFVGNGSDEVLAFSFLAFFNPGDYICSPNVTYSFYIVYASFFNLRYKPIPLDADFNIVLNDLFIDNGGLIIANPNALTGKIVSINFIENILKKNINSLIIIDEAYIDFGGDSAAGLIKKYPNLLIIQTFSKSRSLAGLRIGFALGNKDLIEGLNRVKNSINSYTLDSIAIVGAAAALKDKNYFKLITNKIIDTREKISRKLKDLGFIVTDSKANFIFISYPGINAKRIYMLLKERKILVRYFEVSGIDNFLRVSIGTNEQMEYFFKSIKEIIENFKG
jgi:histidinol-phosphate aminotransferase